MAGAAPEVGIKVHIANRVPFSLSLFGLRPARAGMKEEERRFASLWRPERVNFGNLSSLQALVSFSCKGVGRCDAGCDFLALPGPGGRVAL